MILSALVGKIPLYLTALWLEWNEGDVIPVGNQPFNNSLLRVFRTEPIGSYRLTVALWRNGAVFSRRTEIRSIAHNAKLILKLFQVMAHCYRFVNRFACVIISGRHTRLVFLREILWRLVQLRMFYNGQLMLQTNLVSNMPEVVPRLFLVLQTLSVNEGNGIDYKMVE